MLPPVPYFSIENYLPPKNASKGLEGRGTKQKP